MSMGGLGDSFYEYLLKAWIQSGKEDMEGREMFDESMKAVFMHMLQTSPGGLTYISDLKYEKLEHKMDALACFSGNGVQNVLGGGGNIAPSRLDRFCKNNFFLFLFQVAYLR